MKSSTCALCIKFIRARKKHEFMNNLKCDRSIFFSYFNGFFVYKFLTIITLWMSFSKQRKKTHTVFSFPLKSLFLQKIRLKDVQNPNECKLTDNDYAWDLCVTHMKIAFELINKRFANVMNICIYVRSLLLQLNSWYAEKWKINTGLLFK